MLNNQRMQRGSSLIEVLITLLVFAVGMLGMAALQLNALQGTADSAQRSQSAWILQDISERSREPSRHCSQLRRRTCLRSLASK